MKPRCFSSRACWSGRDRTQVYVSGLQMYKTCHRQKQIFARPGDEDAPNCNFPCRATDLFRFASPRRKPIPSRSRSVISSGRPSFFQVDVVEPWAKELEAKTNGQVKVEILNGTSPLGKVTEQAGNTKDGKVDIALGLRGAEGGRFPGSSVIELPFMVPSALRGSQALWGLYQRRHARGRIQGLQAARLVRAQSRTDPHQDKRVVNLSRPQGSASPRGQ